MSTGINEFTEYIFPSPVNKDVTFPDNFPTNKDENDTTKILKEEIIENDNNNNMEILDLSENEMTDEDAKGSLVDEVRTGNSGRDSGISTESPRYQEINSRYQDIELRIEEKVVSSQRELQEAKKKLEELRLLRFQEKDVLRKQIEELNDRVDEEERNTNLLEGKLNKAKTENSIRSEKLKNLEKEQEIGCRVNMMQEQEIVRLEMKLKQEELEHCNITKQLEQQRRSVIEKDKIRLRQQGEIYVLKERVSQLEESNTFYKSENDINFKKLRECDHEMQAMKQELSDFSRDLEGAKLEATSARMEMKKIDLEKSNFQEECTQKKAEVEMLKNELENLKTRLSNSENEFTQRQKTMQQDLNNVSESESMLISQCEQLEKQYHETRRLKDEQYFELTQLVERSTKQEHEKSIMQMELKDLKETLKKYFDEYGKEAGTGSGTKNHLITCDVITAHFQDSQRKMTSLYEEIDDLSVQFHKEQVLVNELNSTIAELRDELQKAQGNITNITSFKQHMETQQQRSNETLKIQEREIVRKKDEIERLNETIDNQQQKITLLQKEMAVLSEEIRNNQILFKEEKKQLKGKLQDIETRSQITESAKNRIEVKSDKDRQKFQDELEQKECEKKQLNDELEKLIDDNKNLTQRLIHLESYSERLSGMLEKQQNDNYEMKEKVSKELKEYKNISGEKEFEISTLKCKLDEMNKSLNEEQDTNDRLEHKVKNITQDCQSMETKNKQLEKYNEELRNRLDLVNEANIKSERQNGKMLEDLETLSRRLEEKIRVADELMERNNTLEGEKKLMKENLRNADKHIQLKENLITELSKKTGRAAENFNSLRSTIEKAELEGKQNERKIMELTSTQSDLQKSLNESENEKKHLREQVSNLQRVLAKCEDEKDRSMNEVAYYQRQVDDLKIKQGRLEAEQKEYWKRSSDFHNLQHQMTSLRNELGREQKRRERLEDEYTKRDEQVNQLRTTFDRSLTTISKDTKNIKSILGRSLKKIDHDIEHPNDDTSITSNLSAEDTDIECTQHTTAARLSGSRYLNLPSHHNNHTSKSLDMMPVSGLYKTKGIPHVTPAPTQHKQYKERLTKSLLIPSTDPDYNNLPVKDTSYGYDRKPNKRLTR